MDARCLFVCLFSLVDFSLCLQGFDLDFKLKTGHSPRALLVDSNAVPIKQVAKTEFSVCLWAFIKNPPNSKHVAFVSYSSRESGKTNEILLEAVYNAKPNYTSLYISGKGYPLGRVPPLNKWTHICTTWENKEGTVYYYINGKMVYRKRHEQNISVRGNGFFILGQDQDKFNGGFKPIEGLQGKLTQFNLWDRAITGKEVKLAYECQFGGNVINWESATWSLYDNIGLLPSNAPCGAETCKISAKH